MLERTDAPVPEYATSVFVSSYRLLQAKMSNFATRTTLSGETGVALASDSVHGIQWPNSSHVATWESSTESSRPADACKFGKGHKSLCKRKGAWPRKAPSSGLRKRASEAKKAVSCVLVAQLQVCGGVQVAVENRGGVVMKPPLCCWVSRTRPARRAAS